jgi:hypothetical protein
LDLKEEIGIEQGGDLGRIPAIADPVQNFCAIAVFCC